MDKCDLKLAGTDTLPFLSNLFSYVDKNIKHKFVNSHIYGNLWDIMGFTTRRQYLYLGTIIVLVIKKIDTGTKKCELTKKPMVISLFGVPDNYKPGSVI